MPWNAPQAIYCGTRPIQTEKEGRRIDEFNEMVHERPDGRWVVAVYDEDTARYIAPMTEQEKAATGRKAFYAAELEDLECLSYYNKEEAVKAADAMFREYDF